MVNNADQFVGPDKLGRILRLSSDWICREAEAGRLPHVNADGRLLFNVRKVTEVLTRRAGREGLAPVTGEEARAIIYRIADAARQIIDIGEDVQADAEDAEGDHR